MEYIFVQFDPTDIRDVIANASAIGKTEKTLMLDSGYYEISLSGTGFKPDKWLGPIDATAPTSPLSIVFTKVTVPDTSPVVTTAKKPSKRTKKRNSPGV